MFELTLLDHLRLTFAHIVQRQKAHAQIAYLRANRSRWLRAIEALLMAGVSATTIAAAFGHGRIYAIGGAALAIAAFIALLVHLAMDLDGAARAHAASATRLWQMRERYQALLSDLCDGAIDIDEARRRRDALLRDLNAVYENAPPTDEQRYKAASKTVGTAASDAEIDAFLPKPLQRASKPA